ncbi:MAG: recombinase family protein [Thermoflexales bacterium]|nr:recombinase family protein [Thermoflexales bacterium]
MEEEKREEYGVVQPLGRARRAKPQRVAPYQDTRTPRNAVIYVRVSSEEQAQGHSLEAQERECREFLMREKPNWKVVGVFRDEHTGKNTDRPGFRRMMRMVYEGKANAIVCHRLDRFSRSLHDIMELFKELEEMNVVMAFAKDRFDFSTEEGRLEFHILAVFADWYVQNLAREVRKAKVSRVLKGYHNNQLPFGYRRGADGVGEPDPETAWAVREAYERYASGQYTDREIAEWLNEQGFRTRRGRLWTKESVREMLQNEFYKGMVKYRGSLYPGKHEGIVPEELWERVQAVRGAHARAPRVYERRERVYLLSGLGRCAHCGRTLRAQGGRYAYYREVSVERGYRDCPMAGKSIRQEEAEEQLGWLMKGFRLPEDWREEIRAVLEDEDWRAVVEGERKRLLERLQRLGELYADGVYSRERYEEERDEIRRRLEGLVLPDPVNVVEAGYQLETLADVWPRAEAEERQQLCRLMLREVYIDLGEGRIVRVVPDEDFLPLFRYHPYLEGDEGGGYVVKWPREGDTREEGKPA